MLAREELISELDSAKEPSRELDLTIAAVCRLNTDPQNKGFGDWDWHLADTCPHYTASLDAALPGENIVHSTRVANAWIAGHLDENTGKITWGYGRTEALARRIAALKAVKEKE